MSKKRLLDRCYEEQMQEDKELSKENLENLQKTKDVDAFYKAEKERIAIWQETQQDILDLIKLWSK